MKRLIAVSLVVLAGLGGRAFSDDTKKDECCKKEARAVPGWGKLSALVGDWEAKLPNGKVAKVSFRLTSGGSALLETQGCCDEGEMLTIYHADVDHLVLTHYCTIGNQPRMKAKRVTDDSIDFEFLDATNLDKPQDPHMHSLVVRFKDDKHYSETWTFKAGDKEAQHVFEYARK